MKMSDGPFLPTNVVGGSTSTGGGMGRKVMLPKPLGLKACTEVEPTPM